MREQHPRAHRRRQPHFGVDRLGAVDAKRERPAVHVDDHDDLRALGSAGEVRRHELAPALAPRRRGARRVQVAVERAKGPADDHLALTHLARGRVRQMRRQRQLSGGASAGPVADNTAVGR
eukprot:jgi/Chrpa1/22096/Chrysochromulina_OHIO_Genome00009487-RA